MEIDPDVEYREFGQRQKHTSKISQKTGLHIHRNDSSIQQEHNAAATFIVAVQEVGLIKVRSLDIRFSRINIVSTTKDNKYGCPI